MSNKQLKISIIILSAVLILSVFFGFEYWNIYDYNINSSYTVSDDYEQISYNYYGNYKTLKKIEIENYKPELTDEMYIGNAKHSTKSVIIESFYDDKMYIGYADSERILIILDTDFEDDYYYTNSPDVVDYLKLEN